MDSDIPKYNDNDPPRAETNTGSCMIRMSKKTRFEFYQMFHYKFITCNDNENVDNYRELRLFHD